MLVITLGHRYSRGSVLLCRKELHLGGVAISCCCHKTHAIPIPTKGNDLYSNRRQQLIPVVMSSN